jgi:F-type H+-transporting ATPase subunit gamma
VRLDELRARIRTASELHGIASTMRALSQTRLHQARRTQGNLLRYSNEMRRALDRSLALVGADASATLAGGPGGRRALLVLGAEHGFVGALNEKVVEAAIGEAGKGSTVFLAGSRLARVARDRGLASESRLRLATTVTGLERTARALTDLVATGLSRGELASVVVLGPRRHGSTDWEIAREAIFPLAPPVAAAATPRDPPLHYLPPRVLVVRLLGEFLFSRIAGAVAEAFLCEQAARVRAMTATCKNLDDKRAELERAERLARQELITSELLEVVAGAEAIAGDARPLRADGRPE